MGLVVPKSPVMGKICAYAHLICAHIAHWPLRGRVVIKRESGYITKTSHPCISGRGWILKILRTPPGDVEYPYINQELLSRGEVYPNRSPPPTLGDHALTTLAMYGSLV